MADGIPVYEMGRELGRRVFGRRLLRRFQNRNVEDFVYDVAIVDDRWDGLRMADMEVEMTRMWRDLIQQLWDDGMIGDDLVRIHISHRELQRGDIIVPLQRLGGLTPETIVEHIARIMQSFYHLLFGDVLEISVGVIKFPRGHGQPRKSLLGTSKNALKEKNKSIEMIENDDDLCLPRSLVVARAWEKFQNKSITKDSWRWLKNSAKPKQREEAEGLIADIGINRTECASFAKLPDYEEFLERNIVVIGSANDNKVIYPTTSLNYDESYYLYFIEDKNGGPGHFHTVKSPKGFYGLDHFCEKCFKPYNNHSKQKHHCFGTCSKCGSTDCPTTEQSTPPIKCDQCHVQFMSRECFDNHLPVICKKFWQCPDCKRYLCRKDCPPEKHKCHTYACALCHKWVEVDHLCYQRRAESKKSVTKMIFFDAECIQEDGEHIPNLIVAHVYHDGKKVDEKVIYGDDVRQEFGEWLFEKSHKGHAVLAHNMKGYDGYFLLRYLVDNNIRHNLIYRGSKIMYIEVKNKLNMRIIDSLNFFPMPLANFPKSFGLEDTKKGDFPHFFNTSRNQNYIGPYPEPRYYGVDQKRSEERTAFLEWYDSVKDGVFHFKKDLIDYCQNDVDILARSCLVFQKDLVTITGVDPFNNLTIASTTMSVFKTTFHREVNDIVTSEEFESSQHENRPPITQRVIDIPAGMKVSFIIYISIYIIYIYIDVGREKKNNFLFLLLQIHSKSFVSSNIASVPSTGYTARDNYSLQSIQWLKWMEHSRGISLRHALSPEGEYLVPGTRYRVDGYDPDSKTVYQYMGCLWHGCSKCYGHVSTALPRTGETQAVLYMKTVKGIDAVKRQGYQVVVQWEHDFLKQLREDDVIMSFVNGLDLQTRLNPRDSFFGGRTNACKLYYGVNEGEKIRYVDFTSLYPYVNKYCE